MPAGKRGPLSTRGNSEAGGGVLLKSFTPVSDFTEETPQSAYGCQLPFQGSLLRKLFVCSSAAMSKPSGGIARCPRCPPGACQRRLLPFPVLVMLIFRCFLVQVGDFILYGVCKLTFVRRWRGSGEIFCLMKKTYEITPQSVLRTASSPFRGAYSYRFSTGTSFGCPKGEPSNTNLQTPYEIKLPTYTRKRLNINVTNTGKGNNRRWHALGGQRGTSEFRRTVSTRQH